MKIGIIGLPQSGKTTLFKILLQKNPSGNIGVFKVTDTRIEEISKKFVSKRKTYPEFTVVDLGKISDFSKKDLSGTLQDIDLFMCVVGAFLSQDPKKDFEGVITDIILSDLEMIQNRLGRLEKEGRSIDGEKEVKLLEKCQEVLSEGNLLCKSGFTKDEAKILSGLVFLSSKPLILAINVSEDKETLLEDKIKSLEEYCRQKEILYILFFGKIELELLELEPEERTKFLIELGLGSNFREEISRMIVKELKLVTFFTTGDKETKGWYLEFGSSAIEAAGKVHSDMKRGFIRAEVINYEDFIKCGSIHKAREQGLLKVEGKDYIVKDGDIINVRFSV